MNAINERIRQYLAYKGWNMTECEKDCGFKRQSLRTSLGRGSSLSSDKIVKLLETYEDLSAEWLLCGEGDMLKSVKTRK